MSNRCVSKLTLLSKLIILAPCCSIMFKVYPMKYAQGHVVLCFGGVKIRAQVMFGIASLALGKSHNFSQWHWNNPENYRSWWCHQMETFYTLLALCVGEFTSHRWIPLTKAIDPELDVFFDLRLSKWLSKQSWGWWFETPSCSWWRHCNVKLTVSCPQHSIT